MSPAHPFCGARAAIATMHGKERVIAPILDRWFGMRLDRVADVDTDRLGTFTGEIPRAGDMLDTARAKAVIAIERSGAPIGIGSEGAFGPHPLIPFAASGLEAIVLIDARTQNEIIARRRTRTNYDDVSSAPGDDLSGFLARIGFPDHAVIVRPEESDDPFAIEKALMDRDPLDAAIDRMARRSKTGRAVVQTDMRAHLNPTRMKAIAFVAKALAVRAARRCRRCGAPGFGLIDVERGLRCEDCGYPTRLIQAEIHGCGLCGRQVKRKERPTSVRAKPTWCDVCNP